MPDVQQARILIVATDGFEEKELTVPLRKLREQGATVHVAAPEKTREPGVIRGWDGQKQPEDWGQTVPVDRSLKDARADEYDAVILPGGVLNPDHLRTNNAVLSLVGDFAAQGKVVAAICHGPWILVEAGLAKGRRMTSFQSIRTDVVNAGADWLDQEVVADKGIVTSRSPADLDAFVAKIVEEVREGNHGDRRAA
ncbi:type 1 glutamine amidotransferase domain-containing protein [Teichococcus oryzae]|uniref:Type 1 glutamine amidotransferase n=1 Tax=Teichococcus oryzae TaxID=1608942 RepID=A0A5B2TEG2_9PROT|nr:type 1 glutamine amidotransferase domain-containing protein [Pseudoroseomonas oryzae]KAA2212425.1 type 1 glutamine amidotransferase [Pseudoroseomonas oryzae]